MVPKWQILAIFTSVQRWWCLAFTPKSPPRPGVTRHGKPFDTCCRGCALGSGCPVSGPVECGDLAWQLGMPGMSMILCVVGSTPQRQERVVVVTRPGAGNDSYTPGFIDSWFHMWQVGHVWHCCIWCCSFNTSILLCTFEYSIVWR